MGVIANMMKSIPITYITALLKSFINEIVIANSPIPVLIYANNILSLPENL